MTPSRTSVLAGAALVCLAACSPPPPPGDAAADVASDGGGGCTGQMPPPQLCLQSCSSDAGVDPLCVNDGWQCPDGTVTHEQCQQRAQCQGTGPTCCDSRGERVEAVCVGPDAWGCPAGARPVPAGTSCAEAGG